MPPPNPPFTCWEKIPNIPVIFVWNKNGWDLNLRCFFCRCRGYRIKQHLSSALRFFVIQPGRTLTSESQWNSRYVENREAHRLCQNGWFLDALASLESTMAQIYKALAQVGLPGYLVETRKSWNVEIGRRKNFFPLWEVSWVASPVSWEMWESRLGIKQCHILLQWGPHWGNRFESKQLLIWMGSGYGIFNTFSSIHL